MKLGNKQLLLTFIGSVDMVVLLIIIFAFGSFALKHLSRGSNSAPMKSLEMRRKGATSWSDYFPNKTQETSPSTWTKNASFMCSDEVSNTINLYFAVLIVISFTMFTALLSVLLKVRKSFHPFFSALFGLIIFCYQICAAGVATQRIIYLIFGYSKEEKPFKGCDEDCLATLTVILTIIEYIVDCSYSAITALFLSCLIERTVATLASKKYEHSRFYSLLIALLLFTAVVSYFKGYQGFTIGGDDYNDYIMMGLSVAILIMLTVLLITNMRLIRSNDRIANSSLSYKYQLTENLRVVRNALLPIVLLDTSITINDLVGDMVFDKQFIFSTAKCEANKAYPYAFVIMNTLSIALEYGIPLVILCRWDAFHKALPCWLRLRPLHRKINAHDNRVAIRNVFGQQINHQGSTQEYFDILQKGWNKF